MAGSAKSSFCVRKSREVTNWRRWASAAISLICVLGFSALSLSGQKSKMRSDEGESLPATTGEPLTVKPVDLPDVDCNVVQWSASPKPTLTLLCPPQEVFAPLRVLIKLSWLKPEDAPVKPASISAKPGTLTKLHTSKSVAMVRLSVNEEGEKEPQERWVSFNGVVDVALLPRARSR